MLYTEHAKAALLALVAVMGLHSMQAQSLDHKDLAALGDQLAAEGKYLPAAEQYALAFEAKPKKLEYAHQAAEYFRLVKDYARAAELFAFTRNELQDYPLAGLNYARALKQQGRFEEAVKAYLAYLSAYDRSDRTIIQQIVDTEVKGAELARQEATKLNAGIVVEPLGASVNTSFNELAPMPLAPTAMYFISDAHGAFQMHRSDLRAGVWSTGEVAEQFPRLPGVQVGGGAINPTGDRFYFSICDADAYMPNPTARCQLNVIVRKDAAWTAPRALPAYINTEGNSTTTPYVYQDGDREVMLFASDRIDGYGGFDLYRTERYLDSDGTDFSFPENLGPVINSAGDEVTPHYDPTSQTLHFSSSGLISLGGFDIYKTRGRDLSWNTPENLLPPVNSPADEYYYQPLKEGKRAVFASNRATPVGKSRTSHEDLFVARPGAPTIPVNLLVVDSATSGALAGAALAVFVTPQGERNRRLLASELSDDGYFSLALPLGSEVELDVQRLDYRRVRKTIQVPSSVREGYQLPPLRMVRIAAPPLAEVQEIEASRTAPPVAKLPTATSNTTPPSLPKQPPTVETKPSSSPTSSPSLPAQSKPDDKPSSAAPVLPAGSITVSSSSTPVASSSPTEVVSPTAPTESTGPTVSTTPSTGADATPIIPVPITDRPVDVLKSPQATKANKLAQERAAKRKAEAAAAEAARKDANSTRSYRIQIEARRIVDEQHRRYDRVRGLGILTTDYIDAKDLHRVLIGDYADYRSAQQALAKVRKLGWSGAFVAAFNGSSYAGLAVN